MNKKLDKTFSVELAKLKELAGEPVEGFEHIYISKDDEENRVIVILTGLSVPDDRLLKIKQRIDEGLEELTRTKTSSVLDDVDMESVKELRDNGIENSNELNLDDLFSKY